MACDDRGEPLERGRSSEPPQTDRASGNSKGVSGRSCSRGRRTRQQGLHTRRVRSRDL